MELQEIREKIYGFLAQLKPADGLAYDTELFKSKYISEKNFHTIDAMAELVAAHLNGGGEKK